MVGDGVGVVVDGPGAGEEEAFGVGARFIQREGAEVVEPVEDPAAELFVVGFVAGVVEEGNWRGVEVLVFLDGSRAAFQNRAGDLGQGLFGGSVGQFF